MEKFASTKGIFAGVITATIFAVSSAAWAAEHPSMAGHPAMAMDKGYGHGHGMEGMHALAPHNAAEHFLGMAEGLKLTPEQVKQITALRDDYTVKNATAEQQFKTATGDVGRALYADDVDMAAVNALFEKIGKLDAQLWGAFAQQLHDIKALLTPEQKKALKEMQRAWHGSGHTMKHEGMPMHKDMPAPKDKK